MAYKTFDYMCEDCDHTDIIMLDRDEGTPNQDCPKCGAEGSMVKLMGSPLPLRATYRDGVNRFAAVKECSKLMQEAQEQKARGNLKESDRIRTEKNKVT